jgi:3-hydroxy-9,10-secoandrosta-1,3,5(10)-triene-9,17-dione monooxygenase
VELKQELVGRARELKQTLAARAARTEANRAPLDETIKDLSEARLFEILTPKRYGGHELHIDTMVDVSRILASGCMSTGWVASFYIGHNWLHAIFPEKFQKEAFADRPYQLSSGHIAANARAVPVAGGYELTGRLAWSSGVVHADWVFFAGVVAGDASPPDVRMFAVPRKYVEVIDNWFIAGMQGTGSLDVQVEKQFVPEYRTVSVASLLDGTHPGGSIHSNPMYSLPLLAVLAFEGVSVMAGALRGAVEAFSEMTKERKSSYTGAKVVEKATAQMRMGRSMAAANAVDTLLNENVAKIKALSPGQKLSFEQGVAIRATEGLIAKMSCDTMNDLMHGAGTNSFRLDSPLQRFFRDINVVRTHALMDIEPASEAYGRLLFGLAPSF